MDILIGLVALILAIGLILFLVFGLPIIVIGSFLTPGRFTFAIAFIVLKKLKVLKCSWWWILIGLLIPF
jgi:hypothetical protein